MQHDKTGFNGISKKSFIGQDEGTQGRVSASNARRASYRGLSSCESTKVDARDSTLAPPRVERPTRSTCQMSRQSYL